MLKILISHDNDIDKSFFENVLQSVKYINHLRNLEREFFLFFQERFKVQYMMILGMQNFALLFMKIVMSSK